MDSSIRIAGPILVALSSSPAAARVPRFVGTPVVANPSFHRVPNTMMYTVTASVDAYAADADHAAVVGFTDVYTSCHDRATVWKWAHAQSFDTTDTRTWTLYNFQPGTTYHYKVRVGGPGSTHAICGVLETTDAPTPTVPTALADLNLKYRTAGATNPFTTKYVLMETPDCAGSTSSPGSAGDYIVAVDPEHETIVWYLDLEAMTGLGNAATSGWRYEADPTRASDRILVTLSHRYLYEWTFDGTEVASYDFAPAGECDGETGSNGPCVTHDVYRSAETGRTYIIASEKTDQDGTGTEWESACGTTGRFLNDGYFTISRAGTISSARYLMDDYGFDPTVDGGPNAAVLAAMPRGCDASTWDHILDPATGAIDWTHANSLAASSYGPTEVVDYSLREWNEVIRFNSTNGTRLWTFSADPSDSDWDTLDIATGITGPATFKGQHDVHALASDVLMMFDNLGDTSGSRILRIAMDTPSHSATIDRSWAMVDASGDPLRCATEGSAEEVPGSSGEHVLGICSDSHIIAELSDGTGNSGNPPPLVITVPSGRLGSVCATGGPDHANDLGGWHRVFPLASVGAFE